MSYKKKNDSYRYMEVNVNHFCQYVKNQTSIWILFFTYDRGTMIKKGPLTFFRSIR